MSVQTPQSVLILGTGLAGLAAACYLSRQGHRITLLNYPNWHDTYGFAPTDHAPILFGRHQATWRLLRTIASETAPHEDQTVPLEFRLLDGRIAAYRSTPLPGALQWMTSLFSFQGLDWQDRWKLFSHLEQIWEQAQTLPADLDNRLADEWLASIGQSQQARKQIWAPLIQWLTGNALECLSAAIFVRQLSTVFLGRTMDARLTYLQGSVGNRFFGPLNRLVEEHGTGIRHQTEMPTLRFGSNGVSGVQLRDGTLLQAQWYLAALPHRSLLSLLPERLLTRYAYFAHIGELETLPEIAVQCTRRAPTPAPRLILLAGRPFQRLAIIPSRRDQTCYRLSAIQNPALMELPDQELLTIGNAELRTLFPDMERHETLSGDIYRTDEAALSLKPGATLLRPIQQSPIPNLLVAGAWTDTGWPANIESAILSAERCVEIILARKGA